MKIKTQILTLFSITALSVPALHAQTLYDLNDVVLDGGTGANTFAIRTSEGSSLSYDSGTPSLTYGLADNSYSYIVAQYDAHTLDSVGDSIDVSYSFTPSSANAFNNVGHSFRVGLVDSKGTRINSNISDGNNAAFNDDDGYAAQYAPNGTPDSDSTFKNRTGSSDLLWSSSTWSTITGSPTLESPGTGDVTGSFTITLTDTNELTFESQVNGGTVQSVISTADLTTFDTLSIFNSNDSTDQSLTFDQLTVTAVPEPATTALAVGALVLLAVGYRRMRRQR